MIKYILTLLLFCTFGFGQISVSGGVRVSGGVSLTDTVVPLPSANAQLPTSWATSKETNLIGSFDVVKTLGSAGGSNYICATGATCFAALQQAYCDWQFAADQNWKLVIAHGTLVQTGTSVTCTQTGATTYRSFTLNAKDVAAARPQKYFVIHSDTPLTVGQTPCAHATDDTGVRQPPTGDISTWWTPGNNGCANDIGSMWTLEGNWTAGNTGMLIQAGAWINDGGAMIGPSHVIITDVELRPINTNTGSVFLINLSIDAAFTAPTLLSQMPSDIHFINYYAHGDATDWCEPGNPLGLASCVSSSGLGGPGNNKIAAVIHATDCQNCSSTFFYIDYAISLGAEDHLIDAPRTSGPLKIAHGWLSGASNGFFLGGEAFDDPLDNIYDIQFTSNKITRPVSWIGQNYNGVGLTLKNGLEIKNCIRCVIEGNYIENQDTSGGQDGQCIGLNPRNMSNSLQGNNYQVAVQDITVRYNVCRNALTGLANAAYSSYPSNGGGAGVAVDHWTEEFNLLYNLGSAFYDSHKAVTSPYPFRTNVGGTAHICSGTNVAGVQTFTCDGSVDGLKQVQLRVGDYLVITSCSVSNWNYPATATSVWTTNRGIQAISGTTQTGLTVVVANPNATGGSASGCVIQPTGGPYHQVIRHNTVVMQTDAYPSTCTSCASTRNLTGAASISGGLATVTVSGTPQAVPGTALINIINADFTEYNCNLCLVTSVSGATVTYQTTSGNRAGDTLTNGAIQQPPNNAAIFNGGGTVKFFTDTGCTGAGAKNTTAVTAWSRDTITGQISATISTTTGWPLAPIVSPQILVESVGNGTATGTFYYLGRTGSVVKFSQPGATETGATFGTLAQMGTCPGNQFSEANTFVDNLFVVDEGVAASCPTTPSSGWQGWINSGGGNAEGCVNGASVLGCAENHLDTLTSIVTNNDFPGRCMTKYMEVGGAFAGSIPPHTLTGPAHSVCSTATANQFCVGMKSMMNGVPFDIANPDPSQYVLDPTSVYSQGGTYPASDGTDLGIGNFTPLINANHSLQYVCVSACGGGHGPYQD